MLRRPPRSTLSSSSAASDVYKRQISEFLDRLHRDGVLVHERHSERNPGEITGYAVASSDSLDAAGKPVYYGGGRLAADLTLPKLRARWEVATPAEAAVGTSTESPAAGAATGQASARGATTAEDRSALTPAERVRIWEQATAAAARASPRTWWGLGRWSKTTGDLSATRPGPPGWASPVQAWLWRGEWGGAIWLVPRTWKAAYDAGGVAGLIPAKPGPKRPTEWIHWGAGTDHLLPRLIRGPRTRPVFLSERRPGPTRRPGTKDLCPTTGRARLGYDLSLIHISEPTRLLSISYAVF